MFKQWRSFLGNLAHRRAGSAAANAIKPAAAARPQAPPGQPPNNDLPSTEREAIAERDQRHAAAMARLSEPGRADWPPVYANPFPGLRNAVPEIAAAGLSLDVVGGAVAHHGVLLVRGLLDAEKVAELRAVQDRVKATSLREPPVVNGWYAPYAMDNPLVKTLRKRTESRGGNWLADSPFGLTRVIELLEATGIVGIINDHFQERPAVSLQKSTLRCVQPEPIEAGWHQDGSFLSEDVRSMNVWIALSPCGGSIPASGIELIPRRFDDIIPPNHDHGYAVIPLQVIEDLKADHPAVIPEFAPGDALIFDEHLVHRTSLLPGVSRVRYALECWFFAPSHNSATYLPFLT